VSRSRKFGQWDKWKIFSPAAYTLSLVYHFALVSISMGVHLF